MPNKILKNTLWLSGGEIIGRLLRAVVVIYAARVLGAAAWGTLSYALNLAGLFIILTDFGISAVLTRELVKDRRLQHQLLSTAFYIKLFSTAIGAAILILFGSQLAHIEVPQTLIVLVAIMMAFNSLELLAIAAVRASEKMHWEALGKIIVQITIVILGLWALIQYKTIESLAAVYVIGSAAGFFFIAVIIRRWLKQLFTKFNLALAKKILVASWPFAAAGLLGGTMLNVDIIMLGWLRSATEIGYYSAAQKLIFVLNVIPTLIAIPIFPTLARLANQDRAAFSQLLVRSLKIVLVAAIPITIGGLIIGSEVIRIAFGQEYIPAILTFKILLIALIIGFPSLIINNALFAYNQQKVFVKFAAIGFIGNIAFNLALIPYWGIEGAAVSTILTMLVSSILIWRKMLQTNHFSLHHQLNKVIIANLIIGALVWLLHYYQVNFFAILATAIISYPVLLYLLKEELIYDYYRHR